MDLKRILALRSTLVTAITMVIVFAATLLLFQRFTASQYNDLLQERALIAAIIFLEEDEISRQRYQEYETLYRVPLVDEQIQIFDLKNRPAFLDPADGFPDEPELLDVVRKRGKLQFTREGRQFAGLFYRDNQGDFVILVSGVNLAGEQLSRQLMLLLGALLLLGLLINYFLNLRVARHTFRPFARILQKVNTISTRNLGERLGHEPEHRGELRDLVDTLNMFLERLEKEVTIQRMFLKNVSHELNTPLTAIIGRAEVVLDREGATDEDRNAVLQRIVDDAAGLKSLIESLLLISGLESGREKPATIAFQMDELIWEVMDKLKFKYPEVVFNTELEIGSEDQHLLEVVNYRELIGTAILNILDNAIKYGSNTRATVTVGKSDGKLMVSIKDDGPGIPAKDREHIFELFYRGGNIRHIPGHGLGLSLTRQIVDLCGVEMKMEEAQGNGTEVRLLFPPSLFLDERLA
jgi:signal transduction histidine kinase